MVVLALEVASEEDEDMFVGFACESSGARGV